MFGFPSRHTKKTAKKKSGPAYQRRAAKRGRAAKRSETGEVASSGNVAKRDESTEARQRRLETAIRRFKRLKG